MQAMTVVGVEIELGHVVVEGRDDQARFRAELVIGADAGGRSFAGRWRQLVVHRKRQQVRAQPHVESQPVCGRDLFVHVGADEGLVNVVAVDGALPRPSGRVPELRVDVVVAPIGSEQRVEAHTAELMDHPVARSPAEERAPIDLLDLVAEIGIIQVQREVGEQVEAIVAQVGECFELAVFARLQSVLREQLVSCRVAAFVGIDAIRSAR